jgi:putative glutamine amidotransferase
MAPPAKEHPRVGVPWRAVSDEAAGRRGAYDQYLRAIREAGGEAVEISLSLPAGELAALAESVDGIVLTGSQADVDPRRFGAAPHPKTAAPDRRREETDDFLLDHALGTGKPLLAICFGVQSLNVHLGGSLVQDIPSELHSKIGHASGERGDARHQVRIEGGQFAKLAGLSSVDVNSSHHQSILELGRGLQVTARAPDGVIEAVEWTGGPEWIVGVQWHPERMPGDPLAEALFQRLVEEARDRASGR